MTLVPILMVDGPTPTTSTKPPLGWSTLFLFLTLVSESDHLALLAMSKLRALPAPPKFLALPAPPKLSAMPTPSRLPALLALVKFPVLLASPWPCWSLPGLSLRHHCQDSGPARAHLVRLFLLHPDPQPGLKIRWRLPGLFLQFRPGPQPGLQIHRSLLCPSFRFLSPAFNTTP